VSICRTFYTEARVKPKPTATEGPRKLVCVAQARNVDRQLRRRISAWRAQSNSVAVWPRCETAANTRPSTPKQLTASEGERARPIGARLSSPAKLILLDQRRPQALYRPHPLVFARHVDLALRHRVQDPSAAARAPSARLPSMSVILCTGESLFPPMSTWN
jgi:hypothetical protein